MRKHNKKFAQRMPRLIGDRTNGVQKVAHELTNSKPFQLAMNYPLRALLSTVLPKARTQSVKENTLE